MKGSKKGIGLASRILYLFSGCLAVWLVKRTVEGGEIAGEHSWEPVISRTEEPLLFWIWIAIISGIGLYCFYKAIFGKKTTSRNWNE